jgi:hypothetical protein
VLFAPTGQITAADASATGFRLPSFPLQATTAAYQYPDDTLSIILEWIGLL